ncbi:hypothetical protein NHX12_014023 [Muraenolepis orangiensis]|uniref:HMG box domain-containing protein n=1 Tax=Muraenolepis orangiensis TaxID=630683 RepID=A0A9Q0DER9_9TELE|nr:hypothetical protein NHX12_014023 [Muraenolepis orangiensis]
MDLHFYSDLTDETGQHLDTDFLDPRSFNGFDSVCKFPGASDGYLTISGSGHPFLSSSETFHTPRVSHFGNLDDNGMVVPGNAVVGSDDPSFASTYVNTPSQGGLGVISQPGGSALLGSSLGMDLGHPIGSQFSSSSPMAIDVPLGDMGHALLATGQLTIDQSELSAQLGLAMVGGAMLQESPNNHLSPTSSLQDDDMDDFSQSVLVESLPISPGVISLDPAMSDTPLPLSAYSLFFRDTQAAIRGQNPHATFREVSKIVASMWNSLGEEQKQVYKRKNDAAKREYLRALTAYRAGHVSQASIEHYNPEENTITNICTSNIILDLPQVSTRSRTGAASLAPPRQPPPLQPRHGVAPPPPRLQQMVHSQTPPPLQAKPQAGGVAASTGGMAPPPPLKIKIVPATLQAGGVTTTPAALSGATALPGDGVEMDESAGVAVMEVEVSVTPGSGVAPAASVCVRAGCLNPAVENKDWDREYCSNECVATHCRDVFMACCAVRGQNSTTVT